MLHFLQFICSAFRFASDGFRSLRAFSRAFLHSGFIERVHTPFRWNAKVPKQQQQLSDRMSRKKNGSREFSIIWLKPEISLEWQEPTTAAAVCACVCYKTKSHRRSIMVVVLVQPQRWRRLNVSQNVSELKWFPFAFLNHLNNWFFLLSARVLSLSLSHLAFITPIHSPVFHLSRLSVPLNMVRRSRERRAADLKHGKEIKNGRHKTCSSSWRALDA